MAVPTDALQADRAALLEICAGLSGSQWGAPSGCPGWSVKDLIAHVSALFWQVVDPARLPDAAGLPTEQAQEVFVAARRALSATAVLADYEAVSSKALAVLATFAGQDFEVPMGDLGTYPAAALPTAFCFDHYVHIREDLFAPRGPLAGPPPASDALRVDPALDWIEAALPQQNRGLVNGLNGTVGIALTGPGARRISLGSGPVTARITAADATFIRCVTHRARWEDSGPELSGDERALQALRGMRVF
jgi:uncharacterized protein (TIGR03083 family)